MIKYDGLEQYLRFLLEKHKNLVTARQQQGSPETGMPKTDRLPGGPYVEVPDALLTGPMELPISMPN